MSGVVLTSEQLELLKQLQAELRADGTHEELKRHLKARLVDAHWKEELTAHCQSMILERGLNNVTVDELVVSTQQKAAESVPKKVKNDMMEHIRETLIERAESAQAQ